MIAQKAQWKLKANPNTKIHKTQFITKLIKEKDKINQIDVVVVV